MANALAYCKKDLYFEPRKGTKTQEVVSADRPGANVIKLFLSMIYGFLCLARVLLSLDWKSLPMTNALAYYEKL